MNKGEKDSSNIVHGTLEHASRPGVNVGFISLLMIFMVLCLTVFIALALLNAGVDKRLTDRTGETALAYYEAQNRFQMFLSELDSFLPEAVQDGGRIEEFLLRREGLSEESVYDEARGLISARWPAGERLVLLAEILIHVPVVDGARYHIQSVYVAPRQESMKEPLNNLWSGEDFFQ